jgi:hypothetical protein
VSAARGHATTPERPSQASPERHESYFSRREALIREIERGKKELFGHKENFNAKASRHSIEKTKDGHDRSMRNLEARAKEMRAMLDGEDLEEFYDEPEDYDDDWLYYH